MTSLLILLCAVGNCQSNLLTSSILPHSAEFGAPPLQTSFSVADTIATDSLVLPTAFAPTTRESISSTGSVSLNAYNIVESSSFVVPTVTFYATPAVDAELTTFLQSALDIPSRFIGVSATPRLFQTVWEDPSEVQAIPTTAFLDSVAVSRRWDPVEGQGAGELSDVQSWTTADVGTSTADVGVDKSSGRSDVIATSPTRSDHDGLMHSSSTVPAVLSSKPQGKLPSSLHVPTLSTATDMLDMNVTQAFLLYSSAGETSTDPLFSSPSVVSSPSSDGVNSSCSDSDSGCVENGGDGDEEEEIRLKVIIGVACGAVLLVVIFGELREAFLLIC